MIRLHGRKFFYNTPELTMKKFLTILASAAVLAMPLALISTPAAAQTGAPAATAPAVKAAPMKAKHKVKHKAKHKVAHKKHKVKAMPKAA